MTRMGLGVHSPGTVLFGSLLVLALAGCMPPREPLKITPPQKQAAGTAPVTLLFAGDAMLARGVARTLTSNGPAYIWGDVLPVLLEADLTVANLECVIAKSGQPFEPRRVYYFRTDPGVAGPALVEAGIDLLSLANNHIMDYGPEALQETLNFLRDLNVDHAWAGLSLPEAAAPRLLEIRDIRIGFFSAADHFTEYAAGPTSPGIHLIPIDNQGKQGDRVWKSVKQAKASVDLVIYSLHWGPNLRTHPTEAFVRFAHALIDAGADIVHGHSAHVFQGVEWYGGGVILYDTGDLIDDYIVDAAVRNDQQFLFSVVLRKSGILRLELFPFRIDRMKLQRVTGREYEVMADRMAALSQPFGTVFVRHSDRMVTYPGLLEP